MLVLFTQRGIHSKKLVACCAFSGWKMAETVIVLQALAQLSQITWPGWRTQQCPWTRRGPQTAPRRAAACAVSQRKYAKEGGGETHTQLLYILYIGHIYFSLDLGPASSSSASSSLRCITSYHVKECTALPPRVCDHFLKCSFHSIDPVIIRGFGLCKNET